MDAEQQAAAVHPERRATEYLANERTFLAWVRTSIAVISLGFVVAKFGVWLRELALRTAPQTSPPSETSLYAGIAMMAAGGVLAMLAAWRYHVVNRAIECASVTADRGLVILVVSIIALLSLALIVFTAAG
jgi:putative membrane protein